MGSSSLRVDGFPIPLALASLIEGLISILIYPFSALSNRYAPPLSIRVQRIGKDLSSSKRMDLMMELECREKEIDATIHTYSTKLKEFKIREKDLCARCDSLEEQSKACADELRLTRAQYRLDSNLAYDPVGSNPKFDCAWRLVHEKFPEMRVQMDEEIAQLRNHAERLQRQLDFSSSQRDDLVATIQALRRDNDLPEPDPADSDLGAAEEARASNSLTTDDDDDDVTGDPAGDMA